MFYEASYAKKLLAGLSYQAFQADSILRQQLLRIEREREKKGQASLRFNCAFLLSNSVAVKWTAGGAAAAGGGAAHMCDAALGRQGCAPRARGCPTAMHVVALPAFEAL